MKTNAELNKANLQDEQIVKQISQKIVYDIFGSKKENETLEKWLSNNIKLVEPCLFNTYNGLKYANEDAYDELLDTIENEVF